MVYVDVRNYNGGAYMISNGGLNSMMSRFSKSMLIVGDPYTLLVTNVLASCFIPGLHAVGLLTEPLDAMRPPSWVDNLRSEMPFQQEWFEDLSKWGEILENTSNPRRRKKDRRRT